MGDSILFGRWLKQRRKLLDLTQDDLARRVGCAKVTIQKIEAGQLRPSRQVAGRIADQLGLVDEERAAFIQAARAEPGTDEAAIRAPATARLPQPLLRNLPAPPTPLIGRAPVVAAARAALLRDDVRLLTLLGPPGVGKTRLSIAVAAELLAADSPPLLPQRERGLGAEGLFPDGVAFVPLAPISDSQLVAAAIASVLAITEPAGRTLVERLKDELRDRQLLLVLDNFEQVLAAAALVAELLAAAPGLKVLITSRAALHLSGEHEFVVPPLALPPIVGDAAMGTQEPEWQALARYAAVELFVQRAQAVKAGFALTSANARAIAAICARLDGLPLAIELAAARVKLFSPAVLLARLEKRLALLTSGARDLPPRQQTLRSAIEWSYQLLDEQEQRLLARLGVFVGGCTLEAAEAVCGNFRLQIADNRLEESDQSTIYNLQSAVLESLGSLVDKSLLQQAEDASSEPRFLMLETIREYALEQLETSGEAEAVRRRHARWFLGLAERAEPYLLGREHSAWVTELSVELDNLRAALTWSHGRQGEAAIAVRLAGALWWFWYFRGFWSEGRAWHERALALGESYTGRPRALLGAGLLDWGRGDYAAAHDALGQSLRLFAPEDTRGRAHALGVLGLAALYTGQTAQAAALFDESLALFQHLKDEGSIALTLIRIGLLASFQGDWTSAAARYEQSLALFRALDNLWGCATALANLGHAALVQHDWALAAARYRESLAIYQEFGNPWYIASCIAGLAAVAGVHGPPERAARLFSAAEALLESIGAPMDQADRVVYETGLGLARAQLDADTWTAAWAAGRAMTTEQAIRYALET